jgi:hypothetical protein
VLSLTSEINLYERVRFSKTIKIPRVVLLRAKNDFWQIEKKILALKYFFGTVFGKIALLLGNQNQVTFSSCILLARTLLGIREWSLSMGGGGGGGCKWGK